MATKSGATFDLTKVDIILGNGHRVDALDTAGAALVWQGDAATVAQGADNINVIVLTKSTYGILTLTLMMNSLTIDYLDGWLQSTQTRRLVISDRNGRTNLVDTGAFPRQRPGLTFTNSHSPRAIDIHCPNLAGIVGAIGG